MTTRLSIDDAPTQSQRLFTAQRKAEVVELYL